MKYKLNPLTGHIDIVPDSGTFVQKLNPLTGHFNLAVEWANKYKFDPVDWELHLWLDKVIQHITGNWIINIQNSKQLTKVIAYWKALMGGFLPVWYTPLEYVMNIYSGAMCMIDTGITDDTVNMRYNVTATGTGSGASWYILQSRNTASAGWNTNIFGISWSQSWGTILWAPWNVWTGIRSNIARNDTDFYRVYFRREANAQHLTVTNLTTDVTNNVDETQDLSSYTPASTTIGLFWNGTNFINAWTKVKTASIYKNDIIVWGIMPCKRQSDWALGYYEIVSDTFVELDQSNFAFGNEIVPSPANPMPFYCNNGKILAYNSTLCDSTPDGNGTFVQPTTPTVGPRIYKALWHLPAWKYYISTTWNFEIILQYKDVESWTPTRSGNMTWWTVNATVTITDPDLYYGVAIRYPNNNNIDVSDYTGTLKCAPQFIMCDWTTETIVSHDDNNDYTAYAEPLLQTPWFEDTQEILSWAITRNVGIKVLDGTENWNMYNVTQWVLFRVQLSNSVSWARFWYAWCSHFRTTGSQDRWNWTMSWSARNFDFFNDNYTTLEWWKAWLQAQAVAWTPVVIIYQIETPTTETVDWQTLDVVWNWYVAIDEAGIEPWMLKLTVEYEEN